MKPCPKCGTMNVDKSEKCTKCGFEISGKKPALNDPISNADTKDKQPKITEKEKTKGKDFIEFGKAIFASVVGSAIWAVVLKSAAITVGVFALYSGTWFIVKGNFPPPPFGDPPKTIKVVVGYVSNDKSNIVDKIEVELNKRFIVKGRGIWSLNPRYSEGLASAIIRFQEADWFIIGSQSQSGKYWRFIIKCINKNGISESFESFQYEKQDELHKAIADAVRNLRLYESKEPQKLPIANLKGIRIVVLIDEEINQRRPPDPACEINIKDYLLECNATILDNNALGLNPYSREIGDLIRRGVLSPLDTFQGRWDFTVYGQAKALRIPENLGSLCAYNSRIELSVVDMRSDPPCIIVAKDAADVIWVGSTDEITARQAIKEVTVQNSATIASKIEKYSKTR